MKKETRKSTIGNLSLTIDKLLADSCTQLEIKTVKSIFGFVDHYVINYEIPERK